VQHLRFRQRGPIGDLELALAGPVAGRGHQLIQGKLLHRGEHALPPLHQAGVAGDAEDPGPHVRGLPKLIEVPKHVEQSVLSHVLGVLRMPADQHAVLKQPGVKGLDESIEGPQIAGYQFAPSSISASFSTDAIGGKK